MSTILLIEFFTLPGFCVTEEQALSNLLNVYKEEYRNQWIKIPEIGWYINDHDLSSK